MAAAPDEKPAIDSFSDTEKHNDTDNLTRFEDPDAGLSDEERAKIVCLPCTIPQLTWCAYPNIVSRTVSSCGNSISNSSLG